MRFGTEMSKRSGCFCHPSSKAEFQEDLIVVGRESPDFIAEIKLLPTEAGGRKIALPRGEWRTVLGIDGEHWSAILRFEEAPAPGATFEANVWLLMGDIALPMFEAGKMFEVWEGGTKAWGRVKRVTARSA
ncbi:hypothetical protein [Luteibacter sp. dw_328]|uniref:hypothetical protein n=1 Tax=Luteibacter sp. dw_328 TaxID=2719796 RepID=UPI002103ABD8|nr:hypothetical protein [Luteibacter sp. dw_328]